MLQYWDRHVMKCSLQQLRNKINRLFKQNKSFFTLFSFIRVDGNSKEKTPTMIFLRDLAIKFFLPAQIEREREKIIIIDFHLNFFMCVIFFVN